MSRSLLHAYSVAGEAGMHRESQGRGESVLHFPNLFDYGTFFQHIYLHFPEQCSADHQFSKCWVIKEQEVFILPLCF